jgi:hypothetical protein
MPAGARHNSLLPSSGSYFSAQEASAVNRRIFLLGVCGSLASSWSTLQAAQPAPVPAKPKSPKLPERPAPIGTIDDRPPQRRAADRAGNAGESQVEPPPPSTFQPDASDYEASPSDRPLPAQTPPPAMGQPPMPMQRAPQQPPFGACPPCPPPICQPCAPIYYQPSCGRRRHHRRCR